MIPYYSPNFKFLSFFKSLLITNPKQRLISEFQKISNKKYILITNSCRSSLYLAYESIEKKGEVITSPLTCKVAIDPIIASGNTPVYSDIEENTFTIDANLIQDKINTSTIGIQIIHFGGFSCDVKKIAKIARDNNLLIIEDCAQGLFASYKGISTGRTGDIVCFSLIKNAYGISGGIFATNDESIYNKALKIQNEMDSPSKKIIHFRIVRNIFESYRKYGFGEKLYQKFMSVRSRIKRPSLKEGLLTELKLKKPSKFEIRIAASQFLKVKKLNKRRKENGLKLLKVLRNKKLISNYVNIENYNSPFVKFYAYNSRLKSHIHLSLLHKAGIEAKHLEQSFDNQIQERFISEEQIKKDGLKNYDMIHDNLISLPLTENMCESDINSIADALIKI